MLSKETTKSRAEEHAVADRAKPTLLEVLGKGEVGENDSLRDTVHWWKTRGG